MMGIASDYFDTAKQHEAVFRNILGDLKTDRAHRPMGIYIPKDLETGATLEEIFKEYSTGNRHGVFTITNFRVDLAKKVATIEFRNVACLSGGGAGLKYRVEDGLVEYVGPEYTMMS